MLYLEESDIWQYPETSNIFTESELIIVNTREVVEESGKPLLKVGYIFVLKEGKGKVEKTVTYEAHHIINEEKNYDEILIKNWLSHECRTVLNEPIIEDVHSNPITEFTGNDVVYINRVNSGSLEEMLKAIKYPHDIKEMKKEDYEKVAVKEKVPTVHQPKELEADISDLITEEDKEVGKTSIQFKTGLLLYDNLLDEVFADLPELFGKNYDKGLLLCVENPNINIIKLKEVLEEGQIEFSLYYTVDLKYKLLTKDYKLLKATKSIAISLPTETYTEESFEIESKRIQKGIDDIFKDPNLYTTKLDIAKHKMIGKELLLSYKDRNEAEMKVILEKMLDKPKNTKTVMEYIIPKINSIIANDRDRTIDITNRFKKSNLDLAKHGFKQKQNIKGIDIYKVTKGKSTFYLSLFFGYEVTTDNAITCLYDYYSIQNKESTNLERISLSLAKLSSSKDKQDLANNLLSILNRARKVIVVK